MKKILIITDSVSLPRKTNDGIVEWHETYVNRLKQELLDYEFITVAIGGATIRDLRKQLNYYKILKPEILILQCGIVDCAPRAYGKIEMEIIRKIKLYRFTKLFLPYLRKKRAHTYTSLKLFKKTLIEMKNIVNADSFYSLSILPSNPDYEKLLPGISKNINDYNEVLFSNTNFIDLSNIPKEGILKDHHHINAIGHEFIFNTILRKLNSIDNKYE